MSDIGCADGRQASSRVPLRRGAAADPSTATQPERSRLEEGGGARNGIDTLARVAEALGRHLIVSFPAKVPARLKGAVQVA